MLVDAYLHLHEAGVIKRAVYDDLCLQRLRNDDAICETADSNTLEAEHSWLAREPASPYLKRMGLDRAAGGRERWQAWLVTMALAEPGTLDGA